MPELSSPTPLTLRASEKNRRQAPWLVLAFVGFFAFGVLSMWFGAEPSIRLASASAMGVFWGVWVILACYNWRRTQVHELRIDEDGVTRIDVFGEKSLRWEEVTKCRWLFGTSFSIRLRTVTKGLWLHRDTYEAADQLALIRFLRSRVPEEQQQGWDLFCCRGALPLSRPPIQEQDPLPEGSVRLMRRRWDLYFLPVAIVVAVIGSTAAVMTDTPRFHAAPLGLLGIWAVLRLGTPKRGAVYRRINGVQARFLLGYFGWVVVGFILFCLYTIYLAGRWPDTGLGRYMLAGWVSVWLAFVWRGDKAMQQGQRKEIKESLLEYERLTSTKP